MMKFILDFIRKNKFIIIIMIFLIFLILLIFGVYRFINDLNKDKQIVLNNVNYIKQNYDKFSGQMDEFNIKRENLNNLLVDDNLYYGTLYEKSETFNKTIEDYEQTVKYILDDNKKLNEKCLNYYNDVDISQKCQVVKLNYKEIEIIFKEDIDAYNNTINIYNNWTNSNPSFKKIDIYKFKFIK